MNNASIQPLLCIDDLRIHFQVRGGLFAPKRYVRAVDGVGFTIDKGATLGLVGESGSGKTTVGRTILGLIPATDGHAMFDGIDLFAQKPRDWRQLRRRMQIIFQDPLSSLDPRMTVSAIVEEPLLVHGGLGRRERKLRIGDLFERVGLSSRYLNRYPHEFSGGQRQRIGIARALGSRPDFIVCDEPVSALDVSIQAQILNLLEDLQNELGIAYLFIAHNLAVVEHFADEVAVMYLGRIVERASRDALFADPIHPYTKALLSAIPYPDPEKPKRRLRLAGETPSPVSPPSGCPFHPRCQFTRDRAKSLSAGETSTIMSNGEEIRIAARCTHEVPTLRPLTNDVPHVHACLLAGE
jgi:oligopeptide/dipeptide ABC transporter ATP-binding protein